MATYTTNYHLAKPAGEDFVDVEVLNGNMDTLDTELKTLSDKAGQALPTDQFTPEEILKKLKTVDGKGSGLDADLFQGKEVIPVTNGGTGGKTAPEAIKNLGLSDAFYPANSKQYILNGSEVKEGWYTLIKFKNNIASAVIRLYATSHWEESLWIFVDSNYFSDTSPTINIIGNSYTSIITKFRCNCDTSGETGTFTLDAYLKPLETRSHTLQLHIYQNIKNCMELPETIALSETKIERAVVEHHVPCGFESSSMAHTIQKALQTGGVSMVKSIQRGVMSISSSTNTEKAHQVTISEVNPLKSVVIVNGESSGVVDNDRYSAAQGVLTNGTTLTFTTYNKLGNFIAWQVVEYY